MSAVNFLERIEEKRRGLLEELAVVPDADRDLPIRLRGVIQGLKEAVAIYRDEMRRDTEED